MNKYLHKLLMKLLISTQVEGYVAMETYPIMTMC